ncbi:MAG TPA: GTP-binding protein, partial [Ruminococcaceae bacterium]|nr:GTP-binding protein [Oscillospiraceae bacterium]
GEDHPIHTHPLDFTIATPLAIADGLRNTGTTLLEPYIHARFTCSDEHYGRLMSDIIYMRGEATPPMHRKTTIVLEADIPVATSLDYPAVFASYTSGRGVMSAVFCGYRVCPDELGKTMERRGVDPLDRSKYILAARHAMSGTVFDVN